jgi:hypothetical protein
MGPAGALLASQAACLLNRWMIARPYGLRKGEFPCYNQATWAQIYRESLVGVSVASAEADTTSPPYRSPVSKTNLDNRDYCWRLL